MFGYDFVSLSPEQVEARRLRLDQAGTLGYMLPVVLLLATYGIRTVSNSIRIGDGKAAKSAPGSLIVLYRRLEWTLGNTYLTEFGPVNVQLFGTAYVSTLLYIIIQGTGNDYMHVTKAFGHVAVSQLPLHYLLSIKHPLSPITFATGLTHERLNAYHRLLGRIIHALLAAHAVLYVYFFIAVSVLGKRIRDWDVIYGVSAITTMDAIGILTLPIVRQKTYHQAFYRSHVILSLVLLIVVWLHVPYTRNYVGQAAFFWLTNGIARKGKSSDAIVRCSKAGGGLTKVTAILKENAGWQDWVPGMHGYLCQSGLGPRAPFTAIDASDVNGKTIVTLMVRDLGGPMTGVLGETAALEKSLNLELEGPYGEAKVYMPSVMKRANESTLIVAGGIGATYALPIYLALAEKRPNISDLRFVWVVKHLEDARWTVELLRDKTNRNVQIYTTKGEDEEKLVSALALPGIEVKSAISRPNLAGILDSFFGPPGKVYTPATVLVCGPSGLSSSLRQVAGKYASSGRKVRWFEEQFGFGGS